MSKHEQIVELLTRRISNEDYATCRLPGARKLASETGVSYLTVLQAFQKLLRNGVITRQSNGRFAVNRARCRRGRTLNIAFLTSHDSDYRLWENAVRMAAEELGGSYRQIGYSHNDDPVISDVISGDFDLVFIKHPIVGYKFIEKLVLKNRHKVVTMFNDLTDRGVRCLDGPPPVEVRQLVDHLYGLGHRRFASYTISPFTNSAIEKISFWNTAVEGIGLNSVKFNIEADPALFVMEPAYENSARLLAARPRPTALFCTSIDIAIAVIRYCHDHGVKAGRDISVCSFGKPEVARMCIPSITTIDRPSPVREAKAIISDILKNGGKNPSRLMFRPDTGRLIPGESAGPAPHR